MLDATFAQRRYREQLVAAAVRHRVPVYFLHCVASDGLTQARLRERAMNENEVSDGRWEIYLEQKSIAEPLDECSAENASSCRRTGPLKISGSQAGGSCGTDCRVRLAMADLVQCSCSD